MKRIKASDRPLAYRSFCILEFYVFSKYLEFGVGVSV